MSAWFSPEILLTLAGVGLILVDSLAPEGVRRRIPLFALLSALGILAWSLCPSSRGLPSSWSNLFVSDGLSAVFKPFFLLCLVVVIGMASRYRLEAVS